jgi:hypothetical protein
MRIHPEKVENASNIFILFGSIILNVSILMNWNIYQNSKNIIIYFILDLFFFKKKIDILIHHLIIIYIYINIYFFNVSKENIAELNRIIILVEISNIFLILKKMMLEKQIICSNNIKIINNIFFIVTFIYYRIFYYYYYLLRSNQLLDTLSKNYLVNNYGVFRKLQGSAEKNYLYFIFYGLYILNIFNIYNFQYKLE